MTAALDLSPAVSSSAMPAAAHDVDAPPARVPINPRPTQRLKLEQNVLQNDAARKSPTAERENRPPAKRSRKAINCEPCRSSKLKCDRGRPCSSCVLRGTALLCYQGAADEPQDDHRGNRIDPHHEIARIRHSLATLEAYVIRGGAVAPPQPPPQSSVFRSESATPLPPAKPEPDSDELPDKSVPGMLAQKGQGGLYAGPTSMVTHLLSFKSAEGPRGEDADLRADDSARSSDEGSVREPQRRSYDDDLLALLPPLHIIDGLVDFYFEYCNWIYIHVHPPSFLEAWRRFKTGQSGDRLVLSTLCVIMALSIRYLPDRHALLASLPSTHEELGERYYEIARDALSRYRAESRSLSLELVELLLIRTHYLTLSKNDSEEIWAIRGELVSIGTAMGLHRDPDKWRMHRAEAERRRWAWWHIILLERWQCFLFGRPLSIASHHFDTRMPSYVDPNDESNERKFLPNLHLFRLAYILGGIVDDAVSIRPVAYDRVQERDRELVAWLEALPKELDLDEYRVARALASPIPATMRLGVQSIIVRTSFYHIRFTLHRPYAATAHDSQDQTALNGKTASSTGGSNSLLDERMAQSLDTAVSAADKLIQLVGQARPDLLANSSLAVPGHVHWGPFHCFSAAMFFSFQLIANPDQPGANLFRANIRRVLDILSMSRGITLADKATKMLSELAPLYEPSPHNETAADREKKKKHVLSLVKNLAFPYHDSPAYPRSHVDSPGGLSRRANMESPLYAPSPPSLPQGIPPTMQGPTSPPSQLHLPQTAVETLPSPLNVRPSPIHTHPAPPYAQATPHVQQSMHHGMNQLTPQHSPPPPGLPHAQTHSVMPHQQPYAAHMQSQRAHYPMQPPEYSGAPVSDAYTRGAEDQSMWGASVGFGQGEWARFLDVMERPDGSRM